MLKKLASLLTVFHFFNIVSAVTLEDIIEGYCNQTEVPLIPFDYAWMLDLIVSPHYTPISSAQYFYELDELFKQLHPVHKSKWSESCLVVKGGLRLIGEGYNGKKFDLTCDIVSLSELLCYPQQKPNGQKMKLSLTWAFKKSYVMLYMCSSKNLRSWTVVSNRKTMDKDALQSALDHVKTMGFDPNKSITSNYNVC